LKAGNVFHHRTMQLVFDIQNNFKFRLANSIWTNYKNLIIKENMVHQIDTNKSVQLIIYLDPEIPVSKAIKSAFPPGSEIYQPDLNIFNVINSKELENALFHPEPAIMKNLINKLLNHLFQKISSGTTNRRITMIEQIISNTDPGNITIKMLAEKAYLSESRLRSLFRQVTGTTIHHYILRSKIRFAANQMIAGNSVSKAAFDGGFADSSHFHKMMVKIFGITPSDFLQNNKKKQYLICDTNRLHFKTKVHD
jgi:AraC-like DNA-binding protein